MVKNDHFRGMFNNRENPLEAAENHCASILNIHETQRRAHRDNLTETLEFLKDGKTVNAALYLHDLLYE